MHVGLLSWFISQSGKQNTFFELICGGLCTFRQTEYTPIRNVKQKEMVQDEWMDNVDAGQKGCREQNQLPSRPLTCLMTSVPSLEGVVAWSLSESSTSMVFADSVSPLLSLLRKPWGYLMSVTRRRR